MGALTTVEAYDRALALADEVEAAARSQGAVSNVLLAEGIRGDVAGRRGDLAGAEEVLRPLAETSQSIGWLLGLITALWWMGDVILERAANDDLADLIASFEVPPGFEAVAPGAWALVVRGRVRALRGRRDEAVEDLRAAGAVFAGLGFGATHDPWRSDLALVLPGSEREQAQALVAEELRQAEAVDSRARTRSRCGRKDCSPAARPGSSCSRSRRGCWPRLLRAITKPARRSTSARRYAAVGG